MDRRSTDARFKGTVHLSLASSSHHYLLSVRMRLLVRRTALIAAWVSVALWCSCERHHPSELYPAQDGHQNEAATTKLEASPAASPAAKRTPAQFFPSPAASPR
ncbi:MAG: hypothetical protein ACJ8KU_00115 [Chthoniobacterales bacterium]